MTQQEFSLLAPNLPTASGIYKYFNQDDKLIYVGKAKNIKNRVSSYFSKTLSSYKTHELVKRICRIEFAITQSEQDAFLLENTLIKHYQPFYNINLKDDKTYPFIIFKNEPFPRVFFTRKKISDGSEYLGPYTSLHKVRELLDFIKQAIPLRTCKLALTERNIEKKKFKVCLEYHLGNCKGPCEGLQTMPDYTEGLQKVKNLLRGNLGPVISGFKTEMKQLARDLAFEKAELLKKKIEFLENYQSKSVVANANVGEVDVFSILKIDEVAYVNYLMVRNGAIIQTHTGQTHIRLDETEEEILPISILQMRSKFESNAKEIVVPYAINYPQEDVFITIPKGGDKKKLLSLSIKNVQYFITEKKRENSLYLNNQVKGTALLEKLQADLQLQQLPIHIECFDNSHFQGSYPVSAMVCFKDAEPAKSEFRHFNIKTVVGIDDFASMKEAVYRRYKRLIDEQKDFPQLIIIDGGKGQLNAANEALHELQAQGRCTMVGLAKNVEEIFFVGDKESLKLPYQSDSLKFIRFIRDTVHDYGVNFHRNKRSKGTFKNELEMITGIGKNTAALLLKKFRSVKKVKESSIDDVAAVAGPAKAKLIAAYFENI